MSIEIGSKWVKDGEVVEVVSNFHVTLNDEYERNDGIDLFSGYTIWFLSRCGEVSVLTKYDFLEQYKPYEPVYEYKWAYLNKKDFFIAIDDKHFYLDEEEFYKAYRKEHIVGQRLDFTKRERKQ